MHVTLRELGRKIVDRLRGEGGTHRWKAGAGIVFMLVFVVASLAVNQTVLALNLAAGNYGYRSGTYGYNASTTSSDYVPSTPASFACSTPASGTGNVACSWTATSTTTGSTNYDNHSVYNLYYATSSANANSSSGTLWGSSNDSALATRTTTSTTITGLTAGTTYYFTVYAVDGNSNTSAAATVVSAAALQGGGGGGGGGALPPSIFSVTPATPATPAVPGVGPAVPATPATPSIAANPQALIAHLIASGIAASRDVAGEGTNQTRVTSSATEFRVTLSAEVRSVAANFVTYGASAVTVRLGSGERLAVLRDLMETLGSTVQGDASKLLLVAEQISSGQKPTIRNLAKEQAQAKTALVSFQKLTGKKAPDFKNAKDDLAWNTMLYRVRFSRDLVKERAGITKFRGTFNKTPKTPADWAVVRAWAYALR
jgi:hypothetical protein